MNDIDNKNNGEYIYSIAQRLFPICRSITGDGVKATFKILQEYISDLRIYEVPSGTKVFDWVVPDEWNIKDGYIEDECGNKIIDFKKNNLHIMGYSVPIDCWVPLSELLSCIYTEPTQPEVIPYITSYYKKRYGFCMSHKLKCSLAPGKYHMYINSTLKPGSLNYGEIILPGKVKEEILFSTYICHPSMANNECSGPSLATAIVEWLKKLPYRKYTYRIIFIPETIGSITYLSKNLEHLKNHTKAGFNLSCVGDTRDYSMVETRYGNTLADRVLKNILRFNTDSHTIYSFLERGSDERQYNAPGVDLPVVSYCRSKYHTFQEYHTSGDDMSLISPEGFQGSFNIITHCVRALEYNMYYRTQVLCEPQLGKRNLYPTISRKGAYNEVKALTDFIAYADGSNDLIDISNRIEVSVQKLIPIVDKLLSSNLITPSSEKTRHEQ